MSFTRYKYKATRRMASTNGNQTTNTDTEITQKNKPAQTRTMV